MTSTSDLVRASMTTDVICVHAEDNVPDAVRAMVERGIDGAPVVNANNRLVGMLSASDVMVQGAQVHLPTVISLFGMNAELPGSAARYEHDLKRALASTVGELMQREPITISPDATMSDAATLLHDRDVSRLPVADDQGRVVGIVARGDVLRYLVGQGADDTGD